MRTRDRSAINLSATAVEFERVTKIFIQRQHTGGTRGVWHNLLHSEKKAIRALEAVSVKINPGEFVAYAGPNGAGKSTTIKTIAGMLVPESGAVRVMGVDPSRNRVEIMRHMGVLFGNRTELWWDHPVSASFIWKRVVWDVPKGEYERMLKLVTELLDIGPLMNTYARELSLGQRMRCDLAMALVANPSLILLDEPTLGLDVLAKRQMIGFLKTLNRERGATIVVTSHDMDDLEEMAQRMVLIAKGKIAFDGDFMGLRAYIGARREIRIITESAAAPEIPGAVLIESEGGQHVYAYAGNDMRTLLSVLSKVEGVRDVAFQSAPLEKTIAQLYQQWQ